MDLDECESDACQNNGTCSDVIDGFTCECDDEYYGDVCEEFDNCFVQPCLNGGECDDLSDDYECNCTLTQGFYGTNCSLENECVSQDVTCQNGGTCTDEPDADWECSCPDG